MTGTKTANKVQIARDSSDNLGGGGSGLNATGGSGSGANVTKASTNKVGGSKMSQGSGSIF